MDHRRIGGRRACTLLVSIAVAAVSLVVAHPPAGALASATRVGTATAARPNILLLMADDQTGATWSRDLMPRVFDRLVDEGVTFDRAYVSTSLCCPSRAQIMTGLYEHHSGVDDNTTPLLHPTIIDALHEAGYRTAMAGKYLNSWPCLPRPEFDHWACVAGGESTYTLVDPHVNVNGVWVDPGGYTTDVLAGELDRFIAETPDDQPFFAMYSPPSPHIPANDPRCENLPVPLHRPPSYDEATDAPGSDKPAYVQRPPLSKAEREGYDYDFKRMTNAVRCLDISMAQVLDSLGSRAQDTIVVYLSDNGFQYGEHRRWGKTVPYEESVRVPFVVRYPGVTQRGTVSNALVANLDIAPTIAELAGIEWNVDGLSLMPILTGSALSIRNELLLEGCWGIGFPCTGIRIPYRWTFVPSYQGIVESRYKYVEYVTGEVELYDRQTDQWELNNLAGQIDPVIQADLAARLDALVAPSVPATTILSGPSGPLTTRAGTYRYFAQDRFATFECRVSAVGGPAGAWEPCDAGSYTFGALSDGDYRFEVRATDGQGAVEPDPATREFSIHATGPDVRVVSAPPDQWIQGSTTSLAFAFASDTPGTRFECQMGELGTSPAWTDCASPVTYTEDAGVWLFGVRAIDPIGAASAPPAQALVVVDATGPLALFRKTPIARTNQASVVFDWVMDEPPVGPVTCSVDGGPSTNCSSGHYESASLGAGDHSLVISATNGLGIQGETVFGWNRDVDQPRFWVGGLNPLMNVSTFTINVVANEDLLQPAHFSMGCAIDSPGEPGAQSLWTECERLEGLAEGSHTYSVIGIDQAWNLGTMQDVSFVVDTVAPVATILTGPPSSTTSRTARFTFSANEAGATFACKLDNGSTKACTSPATYRNLAVGQHRFQVWARDPAGNTGGPVAYTWTITA